MKDKYIKCTDLLGTGLKDGFTPSSIKKVLDKNKTYKNFIWKSKNN